ncbi:ketopantoate reductase family protein [Cohnella endophytica]|uniref:2-dehydropantoate 2-reductase n=1 Tax=Cohnella endophytica TaxID=2419778 RepID=A0A494XCL7_9BACL|nr:ketopantoate reductase family protein [Cohnella endophytica]RKP47371.1 ketopantoate reductase family protein [Cohnella endophytica]
MKIIVVGAGAIGGYVAARMLEAGLDVTLLVRAGRKRQLESDGLIVSSPLGDYSGQPPMLVGGEAGGPFDLAIIATKAYGLPEIAEQLRPYLHERTAILPFLNGMKHMEQLAQAFPGQPLLGGVARIEITLDDRGTIRHLNPYHAYSFGKFGPIEDDEYAIIRNVLSTVQLFKENADIEMDLWEKYAFINVLSGLTTLFQAPVGDILDTTSGMDAFRRLFAETNEVIARAGGRLSEGIADKQLRVIGGLSAKSKSSMLRDMENGLPTESAHIQGYLVELARRHECETPVLDIIHQRLEIYEKRRLAAIEGLRE